MATRPSKRVLILGGICVAAIVGVFATQSGLQAQDEGGADIVVGTYQPQQVAQQVGLQQQMMQQMQGLQQRMQSAQQEGNQEEMQKIQGEAQQIQQDVIGKFEDDMDAAMPDIAEDAGVDIIAVEVAYAGPGVETKDVTSQVVSALGGGSAAPTTPTLPQQQ